MAQLVSSSASCGSDWCHLVAFDCGWSTLEGPKELHSHAGPSSKGGWQARISWALPSPCGLRASGMVSAAGLLHSRSAHPETNMEAASPLKGQTWNGYGTPSPVLHCSEQSHIISDSRGGGNKPHLSKGRVTKNVWASLNHRPYRPSGKDLVYVPETPEKALRFTVIKLARGMHLPLSQSL